MSGSTYLARKHETLRIYYAPPTLGVDDNRKRLFGRLLIIAGLLSIPFGLFAFIPHF